VRHYPKELNIKYDEQYFTNGIYDKFAHCESQDIGWFAKRCEDKGAIAFCQEISEWACKNSPITKQMRCGDISKGIKFKDNTFDIVTAIEMIEHVSNVENAFKEVSRVLKSNGIFYCSIGLNVAPSHVWVGTIDEWEILINNTSGLQIDKKLTKKIREHPYCMLQNWKTIIARKL